MISKRPSKKNIFKNTHSQAPLLTLFCFQVFQLGFDVYVFPPLVCKVNGRGRGLVYGGRRGLCGRSTALKITHQSTRGPGTETQSQGTGSYVVIGAEICSALDKKERKKVLIRPRGALKITGILHAALKWITKGI